MNKGEAARYIGVSYSTFKSMMNRGVVKPKPDGTFDMEYITNIKKEFEENKKNRANWCKIGNTD